MALTAAETARYSRHLLLAEVGSSGQERLRAARVLVVGAGGLGSPAALYLAASGVGRLGIVDCDRLEMSNLQRQVLYATSDVGAPKAVAGRVRLAALNPEIDVVAHAVELVAANVCEIVGGYDLVLDGSDRIGTRYLVNDACVLLRRPLVSAAIHRFEGQATTYVPGIGPCYRCLFPDAATAGIATCAEAGVLGVLPGVLGVIQATEAIKIILGVGDLLVGRLLAYDALEMSFREFRFERRSNCAVCGEAPSITRPVDATADRPEQLIRCRRLTPAELQELMNAAARGEAAVELVDVREPHEFETGHLPGARSVPLASLEPNLDTLRQAATVVFMCRSGARSEAACALAMRRGLREPVHLYGGLLAWAASIDTSFRVA